MKKQYLGLLCLAIILLGACASQKGHGGAPREYARDTTAFLLGQDEITKSLTVYIANKNQEPSNWLLVLLALRLYLVLCFIAFGCLELRRLVAECIKNSKKAYGST